MPLSPPAPRRHLHTRRIELAGYRREDGLWDIEGHLTDTKTYSFPNEDRGQVTAGQPVHDMWLRLTIDDSYLIHDVEAVTDAGPYATCPAITPNFTRLKGLVVGPGWMRAVRERVGGVEGCTHLFEMLRPMATICYQTLVGERIRAMRESETPPARDGRRPRHIGSCHMYRTDGDLVRRLWPEYYTGPR